VAITGEVGAVVRGDELTKVVDCGVAVSLIAAVSMGDLVKARIDELETNRAYLQSYIGAG
jgi:hypothetical protein